MALSERRILSQVTILPPSNTINVQWTNQVLRDETVISEQYERKAYSADQKTDFLAEVDEAAAYVSAMGW